MTPIPVCVISAGRPYAVSAVEGQLPSCVWWVPSSQRHTYLRAGAREVMGVEGTPPMKSTQLNAAMDHHFGRGEETVATVDDDIVRCIRSTDRHIMSIPTVVEDIADVLDRTGYTLGGPYSGTNTSWAPGKLTGYGRVPGALMVHRLSDCRFENAIVGMEDLDFCIQHHIRHGGVALHGLYCLENLWSENPGGYQDYRNDENIKETCRLLTERWGGYGCRFQYDPTRKNKIVFRVPWKSLTGRVG